MELSGKDETGGFPACGLRLLFEDSSIGKSEGTQWLLPAAGEEFLIVSVEVVEERLLHAEKGRLWG